MTNGSPLIPFARPNSQCELASDYSLLQLDQELDFLLEAIEDEIAEHGEASEESMSRMEFFAKAMNVKVDRIGRYVTGMEARASYCRSESERLAQRARRAQSKIDRTKQMVLYYLESHDLKQIESNEFTLRRQKNSQDSVIISDADAIPEELCKFGLSVEGPLMQRLRAALPDDLKLDLAHAIKNSEPSNTAIKRHVGSGGTVEGAQVKRQYHLRIV